MSRKNRKMGTINLSIRNDNKQAIFCGRNFGLSKNENLSDDIENKTFDVLELILEHLDSVDAKLHKKTRATLDKEHTLIITILDNNEFLHEIEHDISHYKDKNKYKIDVKHLVPKMFRILKKGEVDYNSFEELEVQDLSHID